MTYRAHRVSRLQPSICLDSSVSWVMEFFINMFFTKGPFKYYVIKEVGGWGGQMMMFDDKVGGWWWPNADKNIQGKKTLFRCAEKKG